MADTWFDGIRALFRTIMASNPPPVAIGPVAFDNPGSETNALTAPRPARRVGSFPRLQPVFSIPRLLRSRPPQMTPAGNWLPLGRGANPPLFRTPRIKSALSSKCFQRCILPITLFTRFRLLLAGRCPAIVFPQTTSPAMKSNCWPVNPSSRRNKTRLCPSPALFKMRHSFSLRTETRCQRIHWGARLRSASAAIIIHHGSAASTFFDNVRLTVAPIPPSLTITRDANQAEIRWPTDYIGWRLQARTNSLNAVPRNDWADVAGSTTVDNVHVTIDPTDGAVFFRMIYP